MMRVVAGAAALACVLLIAMPGAAQTAPTKMSGMQGIGSDHEMSSMPGMAGMGSMTPMQHEQMMAMQRMNEKMMAVTDTNPDRAFAKKMMAHHEGAIAMSEIELKMGKDVEAKRLAQKTIAENRKGVAELQSFLASH